MLGVLCIGYHRVKPCCKGAELCCLSEGLIMFAIFIIIITIIILIISYLAPG